MGSEMCIRDRFIERSFFMINKSIGIGHTILHPGDKMSGRASRGIKKFIEVFCLRQTLGSVNSWSLYESQI